MIDRRKFLVSCAFATGGVLGSQILLSSQAFADDAGAPATPDAGNATAPATDAVESKAFSFDDLVTEVKTSAAKPFTADSLPGLPAGLDQLTADQYHAIQYKPERAIWHGMDCEFEMQAFHPGWLYNKPVEIYEVVDGQAHELQFSSDDFQYGGGLNSADFQNISLPGVAGFGLQYPLNRPDALDEVINFLGTNYFQARGKNSLFGLSARGLAVDTAAGVSEEFPRFTKFYVTRPKTGENRVTICAEMQSARVAGAYKFIVTPGPNTEVEVDARIFVRGDINRLGVAPLNSMYLFGENDRLGFDDYRPEVHDSDGLMVVSKEGLQSWRPLVNPDKLALSFFAEENPKGFGLMQRDRGFASYLDTSDHYERRVSLWIEPIGDWGKGHIMLAEIPSDKETNDNIVAFWVPEAKATAGSEIRFQYRMLWGEEPQPGTELGTVLNTRTGRGGPGGSDPNPRKRKFVVEFSGGPLEKLGMDAAMTPNIWVKNGKLMGPKLEPLNGGLWRLIFDVKCDDDSQPVEMTLALALDGKTLTETWMYQWIVST